jgi:hypothetical protein
VRTRMKLGALCDGMKSADKETTGLCGLWRLSIMISRGGPDDEDLPILRQAVRPHA